MTILLILTCLLSASIFTLSLFKRDKIWPRVSLFDSIASSVAVVGSIFTSVFSNPAIPGSLVIYPIAISLILSGSLASMAFTLIRHTDKEYKDNKKFIGMSIATLVVGVINIVLTILIGRL